MSIVGLHSSMLADIRFLGLAEYAAGWSKCLSRKCGAIVVQDRTIISVGWNGPAKKRPHCTVCLRSDLLSGKQLELCCGGHAEANAISAAGWDRCKGGTLYTTTYPCPFCAVLIVNAEIERVVYVWKYASPLAADIMTNLVVDKGEPDGNMDC